MRRALIVAVLLGWSGLASADNKAEAAAAYNEGQQRYAAGDYLVAADRFEAAFALDPDPAYLFNIAQAYRFGNACAKAAASYRKFLGAVANPPNADKVQQFIQQADECATAQVAAERPKPPPMDPVEQQPPPPPPPEKPGVPGRAQRAIGLGVFAGGLAMLGVATYYTRKGSQLRDDREALCAMEIQSTGSCQWTAEREAAENDLEDRGERANRISYISWGVGGAAVIGGVLIWVLAPMPKEQRAVSIVPTPDGAMAYGTFRF
jgi:tetratricopeptide (TPR) repeat protein